LPTKKSVTFCNAFLIFTPICTYTPIFCTLYFSICFLDIWL